VTDTVVIDGCAIATVDAAGTEHSTGHVVVTGGRIAAIADPVCALVFGPPGARELAERAGLG
jgi:hypothetical protein